MLAVGMTSSARADDANGWITSAAGRTILRAFAQAPFPYQSRANGHSYEGKTYAFAQHYNDSTVAIFVPAGFSAQPSGTDFIVHFHGWNNHVANVLQRYRLPEQVEASRVNAILVVPQGPYDSPDSDGGRLQHEPGAFAALLQGVTTFLKEQNVISSTRIGSIVLSAHSGGYRALSNVLKIGGMSHAVADVLLFDAAYSDLDGFADWLAGAPSRRLVTIFTDDTISGNVELMTMLQKRNVKTSSIMQADFAAPQLRVRGATFAYTPTLPHDETMQKFDYFSLCLTTSALPTRP
ncbi:MAG: hypothetical protein DLM53_06415 [Candidatus Eremiobacter antarcticus]|nr:MAG: hypothetical protein DLM53_06415 [Candidatus Eremiobacter sp. RRmetagenome_bin22]